MIASASKTMKSAFAHRAAVLSSLTLSLKDPNLLPTITSSSINNPLLEVFNPGVLRNEQQDPIATLEYMSRDDAKNVIEYSSNILPSWRDGTTGLQRSKLLNDWSSLIKENVDDLAMIMTMESGKPLQESKGEIAYAASFLDYYAGEAIRPTSSGGGTIIPTTFIDATSSSPKGKILSFKEAIGVTAMITPWNFPLAMITRKVGPALATGCTSIVKPSELTPLSAIALKSLCDKAGIPKGVFELLIAHPNTTAEIGSELCENSIIKKLSFTGSTNVGKLLMKQSSNTVKKLSLELGGNAPFIVFEDANINQAVQAAMISKYRNAGQTCVCSDRFLLHKSIEEEFISKLKSEVEKLIVGPGMDLDTTMGPLITQQAVLNVHEKVQEALKDDGTTCVIGGSPNDAGPNYYQPTIIQNVNLQSKLWKSETFGPVIATHTFDSDDEAIQIANDTPTGLAAYFCTNDLSRTFYVASKLENGIVGINDGIISSASAPFGGIKESGLGREGSSIGIEEYLETKYVFLNH